MHLLDQFADELHEWSLHGKEPSCASRDLQYLLDLQEKRLKSTGTVREEEYSHVKEEIRGCASRSENGWSSKILYREANQNITYIQNGKAVRKIRRPVILYATAVDREGHEDREYVCPSCGHTMTVKQAENGCPYCGAFFETDDIYPCISSYYTVNAITERAGLMDRLKKEMIIIGSAAGILIAAICLYAWQETPLLYRSIGAVLMGLLYGGVSAFIWYMLRSMILLVKVFREAGKSLSMVKALRSRKKMMEFMEPYDPDFSYEAFEGRVLSLLRTIVFSDERDTLSVYEGNGDFSSFDHIADMQYRGAVYVRRCEADGRILRVEGTAYLTDTYIHRTVREKNEKIRFTIEKETDGHADPGFSIHQVVCTSCGSSFDAMHKRNCPYCGVPFDLKKKDWIVKEMYKE